MIHKTEIEHYSLDELAEKIGDLQYDALSVFLTLLSLKIRKDADGDFLRKRLNLSESLSRLSNHLNDSSEETLIAWEICKPFMFPKENEIIKIEETQDEEIELLSKKEIKEKYSSICYECINARKPASLINQSLGWVGCAEYTRKEHNMFVQEYQDLGEGWVDLKSNIFGDNSGITTNLQLLTRKVTKCSSFEK